MKKFKVAVQELRTYSFSLEAETEEKAKEKALSFHKAGVYASARTVELTPPEKWKVAEILFLDKELYGTQLCDLLDCPNLAPTEALKLCIKFENSAEQTNTLYNLGKLTEQEYLEKIEDLKNIMQKAGMDTSVLEFDSDPRGIAIKVKKEDWPYRDVMSGIPVLIHESLH